MRLLSAFGLLAARSADFGGRFIVWLLQSSTVATRQQWCCMNCRSLDSGSRVAWRSLFYMKRAAHAYTWQLMGVGTWGSTRRTWRISNEKANKEEILHLMLHLLQLFKIELITWPTQQPAYRNHDVFRISFLVWGDVDIYIANCLRSTLAIDLLVVHRQSYTRRRAGPQRPGHERRSREGRGRERSSPTPRVGLSFPRAKCAFLLSERRPPEQTQRTTCPRPP